MKKTLAEKINKELEEHLEWMKEQGWKVNSIVWNYHQFKKIEELMEKYKLSIYDFNYKEENDTTLS